MVTPQFCMGFSHVFCCLNQGFFWLNQTFCPWNPVQRQFGSRCRTQVLEQLREAGLLPRRAVAWTKARKTKNEWVPRNFRGSSNLWSPPAFFEPVNPVFFCCKIMILVSQPPVLVSRRSHFDCFNQFWLVVWNMVFIFPWYIGEIHPNWLSYISEGWLNYQPVWFINGYLSIGLSLIGIKYLNLGDGEVVLMVFCGLSI